MRNANSIHDLEPQLANCRGFWLLWNNSDYSDGDLALHRSDVLHPLGNGVLRLRGGGLDEALADAKERLAGVPWMSRVGEDSDPGLADQLLARGATQVGTMPVMALGLDRLREVAGPPGLSIEEVAGPDALGSG